MWEETFWRDVVVSSIGKNLFQIQMLHLKITKATWNPPISIKLGFFCGSLEKRADNMRGGWEGNCIKSLKAEGRKHILGLGLLLCERASDTTQRVTNFIVSIIGVESEGLVFRSTNSTYTFLEAVEPSQSKYWLFHDFSIEWATCWMILELFHFGSDAQAVTSGIKPSMHKKVEIIMFCHLPDRDNSCQWPIMISLK